MIRGLFGYKEVSKNVQNQIILPAEFRDIFSEQHKGSRFYIYMEEGRALLLSTMEELLRDMDQAQPHTMEMMDRTAFAMFSKNVVIVSMGADGRITLTKEMLAKAGISKTDKKIICTGADNKIELWAADRYKEQIGSRELEYKAVKTKFEKDVFGLKPRNQSTNAGPEPDPETDIKQD